MYYVGVDVGTGSVRASLVSQKGKIIASSVQETHTWRDIQDHRIFEQSTDDIWSKAGKAVKQCLEISGVAKENVKGVGFDATCSLAVTDLNGDPVVISKGEELGNPGERNIVLWADHRAEKEAEVINATDSVVLKYVGGKMSLEMEIPKILWLKNNMSAERFSNCQFFDLPDWLTYQATRDTSRSKCSLTCKCSYVPNSGWQKEFFEKIGLGDLVKREYAMIGGRRDEDVLCAGMPVGEGLSTKAAEELGLVEGTAVGSAIIDAYAGWLGTVAARYKEEDGTLSKEIPSLEESKHRLAAVAGTSTCHIVQSQEGIFVNGVWGPYKDPIISGWWMNEGGQSSTGQLLHFMLTTHKAYDELVDRGRKEGKDIFVVLDDVLEELRVDRGAESLVELTKDLHLYPDLHGLYSSHASIEGLLTTLVGNRSPIADPRMRGSIIGLELSSSITDLALKYHTTLLAVSLQTRHIIDTLNKAGHSITSIFMSGGQVKNRDLMRMFAEVCRGQSGSAKELQGVVLPDDGGAAVVLGAAMLGRLAFEVEKVKKAGKPFGKDEQAGKLWEIMVEMTPPGTIIRPKAGVKERKLFEAKYKIFLESIEIQKKWRQEMEDATR
ncbi:hypothetical protein CPB83DRAFT_769830 [Crepidotus variabilis]|uniref:FGGY carbohydrate kinase domain-containing protein n=1 Tax=Crepidotus variabilis TaxID=179855 RepID=A0A9P6EC33_9AGAR|nr:hypothetical protein CPB83DRAFT_769830 [Crepidotus variabilis]